MNIAISASVPDLDTPVDPRFGRAACFIVIDPDTMEYQSFKNPNVFAASGAGTQSGQLVVSKGAKVLLTGDVGPKALQVLEAGGVQVITGVQGSIREAVQRYKSGQL